MVEKKRRSQRSYTEEFKRESAQLVAASGEPVKVCARKLDIPPTTLDRWVKQFCKAPGRPPAAGCGRGDDAALSRRVAELEEENAFLGRMVDYLVGKIREPH